MCLNSYEKVSLRVFSTQDPFKKKFFFFLFITLFIIQYVVTLCNSTQFSFKEMFLYKKVKSVHIT